MADLESLPNLEQSIAAFRTAYADLIANKVNVNPNYGEADARTRVVAEWGDFIDGAIAQLQDDYAERRVTGILRLGASRVYRVTANPEGSQTGNVGDLATDAANGVAYIKETGTGNTGWTMLTSGTASLPSLAENNVWLGNASNVATATTRAGVDSTAVHVGTAGEIAGVSGVAPAAGDYLLAEDVDDANNKIRVTAAQIAALGLTVSGTDHRLVRMNGTDGLQDSAITCDDSGNVTGIGTLTTSGTITVGASTIAATDGTTGQVLTSNGAGAWTMQDAPGGVDATAVHTDGSGEIAGVSPITVATGDYVLVEDVGSGNAKGRVTAQEIANLADHDALTNYVANEHIDWTAASAGTIDPTNYVPGGAGTDTTAIHTDEAGEIQGLTVVAPASNDLLVAEDFSNSYNKIRVTTGQVSTLAVGVSSDNRLARYNGSQAVQGSGITVDDSDNLTGVGTINGVTIAAPPMPEIILGHWNVNRDNTGAIRTDGSLSPFLHNEYATPDRQYLASADESTTAGSWDCVLPSTYAGGGLTVDLWLSGPTGSATTVTYGAAIERLTVGANASVDGYAAANMANITMDATANGVVMGSITFADGADMDSLAAGEPFRILLLRTASADVYADASYLHRVRIRET